MKKMGTKIRRGIILTSMFVVMFKQYGFSG